MTSVAGPSSLSPSMSSVPFPRRQLRRRTQRPSPFILSDVGPYNQFHRYYTDPEPLTHRSAFDITPSDAYDIVDGANVVVPRAATVTRPSSPAPTADFSIISPPSPGFDDFQFDFQYAGVRRHARFHTIHGLPSSRSNNKGTLSKLWDVLASPSRKQKNSTASGRTNSGFIFDPHVSYADLPPLDGEEGELIDDEACDMGSDGAGLQTGMDIISRLPCELGVLILRHLDLASVVTCMRVSSAWRNLATDNAVWRDLFFRRQGWRIDLPRALARGWSLPDKSDSQLPDTNTDYFSFQNPRSRLSLPLLQTHNLPHSGSAGPSPYATPLFMTPAPPTPIVLSPSPFSPERPLSTAPATPPTIAAPLTLPWRTLYRTRLTLDERWATSSYAPTKLRIAGHANSVYCAAFDSARIVTGARDHTVRIWRVGDGECLAVLRGHIGSVLCLKFDEDWDLHQQEGMLVTGSSDHTVRVWTLRVVDRETGRVEGEELAILTGHAGGVLDIRFDERWIASSSKDNSIRIWDRRTLALHRVLQGHDGPVNSIAMQAGKLVSASGDGRIIFWDMEKGECLRVLDHTRGHACVDFKGDLIVSGSNDSKIKVWSASTGACLSTLTGHTDLVRALAFDPDAGRLVSASYDMSVRVWDLKSGRCVREFLRHQGSHILDVKFDSCKIVSVSYDKTILVTDFSDGLDTALFA